MGLFLSVVISYAGVNEAVECIKHLLSGVIPDTEPDFQDLVEYYTKLLQKSANPASQPLDWVRAYGQGYLCLTEDENGNLSTAAVKYYDGQPNSTAILFSTKISSFGQESVEQTETLQANGIHADERYTPTKTKTIITNTSESVSVGHRNRSPMTYEHISDPIKSDSFKRDEHDESNEGKGKLTWHYSPLSSAQTPDIHLQPSEDESRGVYSEDFLRSRSREHVKELNHDNWNVQASVDSIGDDNEMTKDLSKQQSFEDEQKAQEVIEEEEVDFWGNSGD